jgi:fumarate reductase subunit C
MAYTLHHPKWHRGSMPIFWWVRSWAYIGFIVRELTSVAVAYCAILLILLYRALQSGPEAYAALVSQLANPAMIAFHAFVLGAVLYHSITWFNLSPKAIVIRLGRWRVPDLLIAGGNYAAWFLISGVIAWAYAAS